MSAIGKLWLKRTVENINNGMTVEEALALVPERWREEVREALEN